MFVEMTSRIKADVVEYIYKAQFTNESDEMLAQQKRIHPQHTVAHRGNMPGQQEEGNTATVIETFRREGEKIGRNDPCLCGSGKKYKRCHGA